ncbi:diacylglycerol kinase alpha-like [Denticeps clupeoides]|uniref:diacylglycerol kinase alpha-like n=1 Tax=Denticeps clupeoides TaxID=299321 RepID=UPI0010A33970|nr:diacylglycerol kinase alpha-like [Denticeps clupeoides]
MSDRSEVERKVLSPVDFIQLQQYMDYCSLKVKDVLREFDTDGSLARHRHKECIDEEGFRLFLKTYLEVEDFPADLCQRLFQSFQNSELNGDEKAREVFLKDVSCYFSLLEDGQPRDKLEFAFKLYDRDGNGLLDSSEVDRIIAQMMHAADYLGWDVTELRPVLRDMMTAIDADSNGTVTLQEWVEGGMNNVPLLVLLGLKVSAHTHKHTHKCPLLVGKYVAEAKRAEVNRAKCPNPHQGVPFLRVFVKGLTRPAAPVLSGGLRRPYPVSQTQRSQSGP